MTGYCEHCNELSGSVKSVEFFDQFSNCSVLGKTHLSGVGLVC
jgi:hypothetical protein